MMRISVALGCLLLVACSAAEVDQPSTVDTIVPDTTTSTPASTTSTISLPQAPTTTVTTPSTNEAPAESIGVTDSVTIVVIDQGDE